MSKHKIVVREGVDWAAIKLDYMHSALEPMALAKKYDVPPATMRQRVKRGGWAAERHSHVTQVTAQAHGILTAEKVSELTQWNADDLRIARALRAQIAASIKVAQDRKAPLSASELRALAGAAEQAQKMGRLALGVSTENLGLGGTGGQGPIQTAAVPMDAYIAARKQALADF